MSKVNTFIFVIALVMFVLSAFLLNFYKGEVIETYDVLDTDQGYAIPYFRVEDTDTVPFATAFMIHGEIGNKTSMKHIATYLAHLGINVYIIDLPGYGDSKTLYNDKSLNDLHSINYFYKWLEDTDKILNDNMIFLGNSRGGDALVKASLSIKGVYKCADSLNYSKEQVDLHLKYRVPKPDTMILISSFPEVPFSKDHYENIFVLTESLGDHHINTKIEEYKEEFAINNSEKDKSGIENITGDNRLKSKIYGISNSVGLIYSQKLVNDILKWVVDYYSIDLKDFPYYDNPFMLSGLFRILLIISMFILIFPISNMLSKVWFFDFKKPREPHKVEGYRSIFFKKMLSLLFASGISMLFVAFGFLQIKFTGVVVSVLMYHFIINVFLFRNYIFSSANYDRDVFSKILLSILISIVLYFVVGAVSHLYINEIMIQPVRIWRFLIVYIVCVCYFVSDEFLYRTALVRYNSDLKTWFSSFFISLLDKLFTSLLVFFIFLLYSHMDYVLIVKYVVVFTISVLLFQIVSIYLFRKFRSYYVTGFLNAFVIAWFLSVIPPIVLG